MKKSISLNLVATLCLVAACGATLPQKAAAQEEGPRDQGARRPYPSDLQQPVYRVAKRNDEQAQADSGEKYPLLEKYPQHPLAPLLRWAYDAVDDIRAINDYSATFVKRERVDGELGGHQYMFTKIRHKPFSVYMYFLAPKDLKGQEALFVRGANDGKMWGHAPPGTLSARFGTVSLKPDGMMAMKGNKHPITEAGILHLTEEIIRNAERDIQYAESEVKMFNGARINGRVCTCFQIVHPVPRRNFAFHMVRLFVDDELNVPIRYEAYGWPKKKGGDPVLEEEYTYLNLKLNNGFTDRDFDVNNPDYGF